MNYNYLQDLLSLTMDINPNEIASQIADDHLGRFCDRIRGEIAGIVEKMCIDGYLSAKPIIHCIDCVNFKNGKCEEYGHLVPDDFYCGTGEWR